MRTREAKLTLIRNIIGVLIVILTVLWLIDVDIVLFRLQLPMTEIMSHIFDLYYFLMVFLILPAQILSIMKENRINSAGKLSSIFLGLAILFGSLSFWNLIQNTLTYGEASNANNTIIALTSFLFPPYFIIFIIVCIPMIYFSYLSEHSK